MVGAKCPVTTNPLRRVFALLCAKRRHALKCSHHNNRLPKMTTNEIISQKLDRIISLLEARAATPVRAYQRSGPHEGIKQRVFAWHATQATQSRHATPDIAIACGLPTDKATIQAVGQAMMLLGCNRWRTNSARGFTI